MHQSQSQSQSQSLQQATTTEAVLALPAAAAAHAALAHLDAELAKAAEAPARQLARTLAMPVRQLGAALTQATASRDLRPIGAQALALVAAVHAAVDNLTAHTHVAAQGPVERLRAEIRPALRFLARCRAQQAICGTGPGHAEGDGDGEEEEEGEGEEGRREAEGDAEGSLPAMAAAVADRLAQAAGTTTETRAALSGAIAGSGWLTLVHDAVHGRSVRFDVYPLERDRRPAVDPKASEDGDGLTVDLTLVMPSLAIIAPAVLSEHRRQLRAYAGCPARMTATHALWRIGCSARDIEVLVRRTDDAAVEHVRRDLTTAFLVVDAPSLPLYPVGLVPALRAFCLARLAALFDAPMAKRPRADGSAGAPSPPLSLSLPAPASDAALVAPCVHTLASAWTWACREQRRLAGSKHPRVVPVSVVEWVRFQADWEATCFRQPWFPGAAQHFHRSEEQRELLSVRLLPACLRPVLIGAAWQAVLGEPCATITLTPMALTRMGIARCPVSAYTPPADLPPAVGAVADMATTGNPFALRPPQPQPQAVDPRFNDPEAASDVDEDELVGQSMLDPPIGFGVPTAEELARLNSQADEFAQFLSAAARVEFASERWDPASQYFAPFPTATD